MTFTNLQIWVIFLSFFTTIFLAILWQKRDQKSDKNKNNQEHFWVLMSVFFWSAFLAFTLKLWLDFLKNINFEYINSQWFSWFSIWMEEIVKIFALIIWLNIAWKRFNEISDWVIYWVFAILWFLFFENIFYMLAYWDFATWMWNFAGFVWQRNSMSFAIHLSTLFFAIFYAKAYLSTQKTDKSRPAPRQIISQIKLLWKNSKWEERFLIWLWRMIISPFTLLANIFTKLHPRLWVALFWSFFITIILHIWLDELMWLWWGYAFFWLIFSWFIWWIIFKRFDKLDAQIMVEYSLVIGQK